MSAVDFIRSIRLEHARQLFDEMDLNVSQVADQVGFATLQYFIKCFRREYGCTPNEYIKGKLSQDRSKEPLSKLDTSLT
jgi:AraC-like DNA-binding protein